MFVQIKIRNKFDNGGFVSIAGVLLISILALMPLTPLQAVERQVLHGSVPRAAAESRVMGPVDRSARINYSITLPLRNQAELAGLKKDLYDPKSPKFRQFLSSEEFASRFGPSQEDYQKVIEHAQANGMTITMTHPNRTLLEVSGAVPDVERYLHVNMMRYKHKNRGDYRAPDRDPAVDIGVPLLGVAGLNNFSVPRPAGLHSSPLKKRAAAAVTKALVSGVNAQVSPPLTGSGPIGLFIGGDFRAAYLPGVTLTGEGQTVALIEFDGYFPSDVQKNFENAGLTPLPIQTVVLNGSDGSAGSGNNEVALDIQMVAVMAPKVKLIVYESFYPYTVLNRAATDNLASVVSCSWTWGYQSPLIDQILQQYAVQGQSFVQSSGDDGAYPGDIPAPSDSPYATVVGGTTLTTSSPGGPWKAETAWSRSGGGVSTDYAIPDYQQGFANADNGGSSNMRNVPDVAMIADEQIALIANNGEETITYGTSAAAPLWGGVLALVNQQAAAHGLPPVGFANPALYALNPADYAADFHDITVGDNGAFPARNGYDLVTGLGSPTGQHLIDDLSGVATAPTYVLTPSPGSLAVDPGSTGFNTVMISPINGFGGNVNLVASGLPTGVTAVFSPASASTSSTLAFAVARSAIPGTYNITIQGTPPTRYPANISLTVKSLQPSFILWPVLPSLSIAVGNSSSSKIRIGPTNGFNGSVTLAISGVPSGVTASLSPVTQRVGTPTTSDQSFLSLAVSSSAKAGTYPLTIQGTSGTLTSSTTVALTISVPSFELEASPATLTVAAGSSSSTAITISPNNGFNSSVNLVASDLPTGVTASFSPATTSGTSTLTFAASSSAKAAGPYIITVQGTSQGASPGATGTYSNHNYVLLTIGAPK